VGNNGGQSRENWDGKNKKKKKQKKKQRRREKKKKLKRERTREVKRVAKEWEIWNEEEEAVKSEAEAKKLVPEQFYRWIKVFGKKQSERMPIWKIWDHAINMKECQDR